LADALIFGCCGREDWGEKYDGVGKLGLYLLSVESGHVATLQGIDPNTTPGQVYIYT
jgi:hypothetical protein